MPYETTHLAAFLSKYSIVNYIFGDALTAYFDTELFLATLYRRATSNGNNIEIANLGPNFSFLPKAVMVTGLSTAPLTAIASYGDHFNADEVDIASRKVFDGVKTLLGFPTINNLVGNEAAIEKAKIKKHMQPFEVVASLTEKEFENLFRNWKEKISFNDAIRHTVMQVLAKNLFGLPYIDIAYVQPLTDISNLITNPWVTQKELEAAHETLKSISAHLVDEMIDEIDLTKYAADFAGVNSADTKEMVKQKLKDTNIAGSFLAITNLANLIMKTIAEINIRDDIRVKIKNDTTYLKAVFCEAQRLFSPSLVARRNSRPFTLAVQNIAGEFKSYYIPPNSYLFAPIRPRHLDENLWENPLIFCPDRFIDEFGNIKEGEKGKLFTFSNGRRSCPAKFGYAESIFTSAILTFCKSEFVFEFDKKLECESVFSINTDWQEDYTASLTTLSK